MKYLFAMDIDGTSLKDNQTFSPKTLEVLSKVKQLGHEYIFVTGRSREMVAPLMQNYNLNQTMILNNGHETFDINRDSRSFVAMDNDKFMEIASILQQYNYLMSIYTIKGKYILIDEDEFFLKYTSLHGMQVEQFPDFCAFSNKKHLLANTTRVNTLSDVIADGNGVLKIDAVLIDGTPDDEAIAKINGIEEIDLSSSYGKFLEVCQSNTNKAQALKKYADTYQFSNDNIDVFGDGINDLSLFEDFTNSVAPSNAKPIIKEKASQIIGNNNDDAVALFIEKIIE